MMKKATITKTVDLLDGGCNVCGIIENENYILKIDEQEIPLEELTVNALITAIVLKNGYKRKYETDVIDDYILYINEGHQVRLKEEYNYLIYSSDTAKVETQDQIVDEKQLVEKVNEILETLFKLEELEFCF